jgi:hypothetical protein
MHLNHCTLSKTTSTREHTVNAQCRNKKPGRQMNMPKPHFPTFAPPRPTKVDQSERNMKTAPSNALLPSWHEGACGTQNLKGKRKKTPLRKKTRHANKSTNPPRPTTAPLTDSSFHHRHFGRSASPAFLSLMAACAALTAMRETARLGCGSMLMRLPPVVVVVLPLPPAVAP